MKSGSPLHRHSRHVCAHWHACSSSRGCSLWHNQWKWKRGSPCFKVYLLTLGALFSGHVSFSEVINLQWHENHLFWHTCCPLYCIMVTLPHNTRPGPTMCLCFLMSVLFLWPWTLNQLSPINQKGFRNVEFFFVSPAQGIQVTLVSIEPNTGARDPFAMNYFQYSATLFIQPQPF